MFADDTNLFYSHKNIPLLFQTVNAELQKLTEWFSANSLSLNLGKTKYALFHSRGKKVNEPLPSLRINDHEIERQQVNKFLGILIHENLTWDDHVRYIKQKISKSLGILYKTRHIISRNSLIQLYFSFINSYLNYGNIIWGSTYKKTLEPLFIKQKHAARIIFNQHKFYHAEPLLKEMKALNIYELNIFNTACFMFKNQVLKQTPRVFESLSKINSNKYHTRSCGNLKTPYCKTLLSQKSISYRGPTVWNYLNKTDQGIKNLTYCSFKLKVKDFLLKHDIKTENFF